MRRVLCAFLTAGKHWARITQTYADYEGDSFVTSVDMQCRLCGHQWRQDV